MKLKDIAPTDNHMKRWSDKDLDILFKKIKTTTLTKEDTRELAVEIETEHDLGRTEVGIYQILIQLHMIVHGSFPEGVIVGEGRWTTVGDTIVKFGRTKGYEAEENIKKANTDMKDRVARKKAKVSKEKATKMMADYYKANKADLPKTISKQRDALIKDIMIGTPVDKAFNKYK